ncbi:rod shape-determining protein MreC [Fodinibius salinus]|uniref:Cell shape-determining protein MreC n=1 Tax=Fodinibius salinus TaxID=860790 RepID=A0A5D3YH07_9BACT|nr:rod shape-determining protein MreC [Fodinibius salinus]TYP92604.1 rod shape-determining protein MreC [Fodinibius salinus]
MRFRLPSIADVKDHILTAVFLLMAVTLMVGRYQGGLDNLRKVSVTLFSYLEEPLSNIRVYRQALKTNTQLRKQNVLLLDELNRLRAAEQQNRRFREMLQFKRSSELSLYPVQIVGKELNQVANSLTIDAGTNQGIKQGMPMVSADGLIGKVIITSPGYSQVMPFFNTLFRLSAKLQTSNAMGIISWDNESISELQLNYIPQTISVDSGETVVTSGSSNQFPPDIPIGTVVRTEQLEGKETQKVFVKPFANLHTVAEGFIIKFKPDTSIKKLNKQYEDLLE